MRCPNCGGFVGDDAIFCTNCGAQLAPQAQAPSPTGQLPSQPYQYPPPGQQPYQQQPQYGAPPPYPQPPPYQQPYQYQPKLEEDGVAVLKGLALIAVIIIILAVVAVGALWFLFTGIVEQVPDGTTINLAAPEMKQRDISNVTYWDAVISVNMVTPRDSGVPWLSVVVVIKSADGSVLLTETTPLPDSPTLYDDGSRGLVDVQVWYVETGGDPALSAGDDFKITGMSTSYEGALVEFTYLGDRIGSITLPTDFP